MPRDVRFWRNVVMIGLAHVAVLAGLMHWSSQAKPVPSQSIVWMDGGGGESPAVTAAPPAETPIPASRKSPPLPESESTPEIQPDQEQDSIVLTAARSEIELPTSRPTPSASATPTPKPSPVLKATPKPTPKVTPKPKPKETPKPKKAKPSPTPKKLVLAKASPKSMAKPTPAEVDGSNQAPPEDEKEDIAKPAAEKQNAPKNERPAPKTVVTASSNAKGSSSGGGGHGGAGGQSQFGWYGSMLHDRFHGEWDQPSSSLAAGSKVSVLVKVRIEKDGRVSSFEIVKPSGNAAIDDSVAAVAKRVTQVDPLPDGLGNGEHYDVKINFELSSEP